MNIIYNLHEKHCFIKLITLTREFSISIFNRRTRININSLPGSIDDKCMQKFHLNIYLPSRYSNSRYSIYNLFLNIN